MRRILQSSGAEVIHLGHNRAVKEIVDCAIQEDAQGIAITSYQGGHVEYLKYMYDLLKEAGAPIKIFAGGGGTILPTEIEELHAYGIDRIYSPDDGRAMGLQGMINDLLRQCDFPTRTPPLNGDFDALDRKPARQIAQLITVAENHPDQADRLGEELSRLVDETPRPVLGITGTGGAGKSSLVDELVRRAEVSLWIATANVKDLHVEAPVGTRARARGRFVSIVTLLADLVRRGVEVRLLHAGNPSRRFQASRRRLDDELSDRIEVRQCPRVHFKMIAVDGAQLYLGSANLTGAGLGAKGDGRRNFETGVVTEDEGLLDEMQDRFDRIWSGRTCTGCRLRAECPAPLDGVAA